MIHRIKLTLNIGALLIAACTLAAAGDDIPMTGRDEPRLAAFDQLMSSFMKENDVPGASLAIARHGKIVYARGFGYADQEKHQPVQPDSLFRIASVSKPFTAVAILQLQERGKLRLRDRAFEFLGYTPHLESGAKVDPRLEKITIEQLLHHTGGFDRDASFDPMFRGVQIAKATGVAPPAMQRQIIEYMMGRPLDFDPGSKSVYSNFGYCVLGRIVEKASGMPYDAYVKKEVLQPLGIDRMRVGLTFEHNRAPGEVRYYPRNGGLSKSVWGDGRDVPVCYGGFCVEVMDSHGAWIASAPELVRFGSAFDDADHCAILKTETIRQMFERPKEGGYAADGKPKSVYYACGWFVRPVADNHANTWHNGMIPGTAALLVRNHDGFTWAVAFNREFNKSNKYLNILIDPLIHSTVAGIKEWPGGWEFSDASARGSGVGK